MRGSPCAIDLFVATLHGLENAMTSQKGPNIKKKQKCKNCEGKGMLKKGDKIVKCQRCGGTGVR
jgi:DnaJ-class molecular chaperone